MASRTSGNQATQSAEALHDDRTTVRSHHDGPDAAGCVGDVLGAWPLVELLHNIRTGFAKRKSIKRKQEERWLGFHVVELASA